MSLPITMQVPLKIVSGQFFLLLVAALVTTVTSGVHFSAELFLGGLSVCLPTLLFVKIVFSSLRRPSSFLTVFMVAEAGRLFLAAILLILVVKYISISWISALIGFATAFFAFWVASLCCLAGSN